MPKLLYYDQLHSQTHSPQFKKVVKALEAGDFSSADVKKMAGTDGLYRAKLDRSDRLLFKYARYQGETYLLLLEVIPEHHYEGSRFLRGAAIDELKYGPPPAKPEEAPAEAAELVYVNPQRPQFHLLDKVISFDEDQRAIFDLPVPLIIIGSAGSGKTALTLEKMKHFRGQVAYLSLSPYLVENAERIYYASGYQNDGQEVDFISFEEYLQSIRVPAGREVTFRDFDGFYARYRQTFKFKEPYKLYEEFKGVLTGSVVDKAYLSREDYLSLGVKQSIFLQAERDRIYDLFERFLEFLDEAKLHDPNMVAYDYLKLVQPRYDFIVVDEVQDITNIQLLLIIKSLLNPTHFLLSGDSNQIVHPNFFSWSKIKTLFFEEALKGSVIRILKTNYRNSRRITRLSNDLLKIKNARFGSIDKESTYLIDTVSEQEGEIAFFSDSEKVRKELNQKTSKSARYAVLAMDKEDKARIRRDFDTPLVFTIQEAKGLEYENIILVNFISGFDKEFREITRDITPADLEDEKLNFSRAKDKENKELEAYKFYINSLYVAFTRAVKNLYLVEKESKHDLLRLLGIVETRQKVDVKQEASTDAEWLDEARRLEKQGKVEQAQEIRDRLRGVKYLSPEDVQALKTAIFGVEKPRPDDCKQLFEFAKARYHVGLIRRLHEEAHYGPAKQYMGEYHNAQGMYMRQVRNGNVSQIKRFTSKYGIDFPSLDRGMTGLMLAIFYNKPAMLEYFIGQEASPTPDNDQGRTVFQIVLLSFQLKQIDGRQFRQFYLRFGTPSIKVRTGDQIIKISNQSMEYFLVNYFLAVRDDVIDAKARPQHQGLWMDDFMEFIERLPEGILPEYRRKRQYVNSILSKNEVDRDDKYNRRLFRRKSRGCYNLYEDLTVIHER